MAVRQDGKLTPKSDQTGITVNICNPDWFDASKTYMISNAPTRTSSLSFSGTDLNYAARVLYAEASGTKQLSDKKEREREKQAILNVKHFRLNRSGYPNRSKPKSFADVCNAPNQFESVFAASPKFAGSASGNYESLNKNECSDLVEAIQAVKAFLENGPNEEMIFDNFRGGKGSRGETIGLSRFWLSPEGKKLHDKEP